MIRDLIGLTIAVAMLTGCGPKSRRIETLRQGAEDVVRHAKEIEAAAQPGQSRPEDSN